MRDHGVGFIFFTTLNTITAHFVNCLRRKAEVSAYWHALTSQAFYKWHQPLIAFDFNHVSTGLHDSTSAVYACCDITVGHKWQVGHDKCLAFSAGVTTCYSSRVIDHFFQCDWNRTGLALNYVTE